MTALPQANQIVLEASDLSAYNVCLDFESNASSHVDVMHARVLGYLILHAPSRQARRTVVEEIHSCDHNHNTLSNLGKRYIKYYIRLFKKFKLRMPASSSHSSRLLPGQEKMDIMATIKEAPRNHTDAKKQALIRDGFRCVVTGKYDLKSALRAGIEREEIRQAGVTNTECVHIIPYCTYYGESTTYTDVDEKDYSGTALAVLGSFGYDTNKLNGAKVHSLYNVMTMHRDMHEWFDRLELWFEATDTENRYLVKTIEPLIPVPESVTFTSTHPDTLPVPSPELLALHAACAKVAHFSGASEYIDKFDQYIEELDVLAPDGSSVDVLCYALDGLVNQYVRVGA